jgi:hypothetical protein
MSTDFNKTNQYESPWKLFSNSRVVMCGNGRGGRDGEANMCLFLNFGASRAKRRLPFFNLHKYIQV